MKSIGLSFVLFVCLFIACKKNKTSPPPNTNTGNCKIASFTDSTNGLVANWKITYADSGRLSQIVYSLGPNPAIFVFSYHTDIINSLPYHIMQYGVYSGDPSNPANLQISYWGAGGPSGVLWDTTKTYNNGVEQTNKSRSNTYAYDSQGELIMEIEKAAQNPLQADTILNTWQDGNLISELTQISNTTKILSTYQYYTDKLSMKGDPLWRRGLIPSGAGSISTKNLIKSETINGAVVTAFNYVFDTDGKILQYGIPGSSSYSYTINHWQCQ